MQQPFLAEQADIEVDAVERAERADRIGPVLQHPRGPTVFGGSKNCVSGPLATKSLNCLLFSSPPVSALLSPAPRNIEPRAEIVDRVHRPRIVDVVGRHQRGVHRARPVGVDELVHEVLGVGVVHEQPVDPEVLRADDRTQIGPFRAGRVRRRIGRARADMAEPAGHADPIGTDQILVIVIGRIGVVALGVPALRRGLVEIGVREQAQPDNAGRIAVIGADRDRPRRARRSSPRDISIRRRTGRPGSRGAARRATGRSGPDSGCSAPRSTAR